MILVLKRSYKQTNNLILPPNLIVREKGIFCTHFIFEQKMLEMCGITQFSLCICYKTVFTF